MGRFESAGSRRRTWLLIVAHLEVGIAVVLTGSDVALQRAAIVARLWKIVGPAVFGTLVLKLGPRLRAREVPITLAVLAPRFQRAPSINRADRNSVRALALGLPRHHRLGPPRFGLVALSLVAVAVTLVPGRATHLGHRLGAKLARELLDGRARLQVHANIADRGGATTLSGTLLYRRVLLLFAQGFAVRITGLVGLHRGALT